MKTKKQKIKKKTARQNLKSLNKKKNFFFLFIFHYAAPEYFDISIQ